MTALTELREEAALQPDGSRAKRLLTWAEIHFGDSAERILELEEEASQVRDECEALRTALATVRSALDSLSAFARDRAFSLDPEIFSRDFSGYINLMGGLGDPDYRKGELSARHADLRTTKPRKTKEAAK